MINATFDEQTKPLITPEAFYGRHEKICVITFSHKAMEWALSNLPCIQVAENRY